MLIIFFVNSVFIIVSITFSKLNGIVLYKSNSDSFITTDIYFPKDFLIDFILELTFSEVPVSLTKDLNLSNSKVLIPTLANYVET